jgi:RIO-like serine/threonine protein kinase
MTKDLENFIAEIEEILKESAKTLSDESKKYLLSLKEKEDGNLTKNGAAILRWMQENRMKYHNIFTAKIIGEGLFLNPKSVSGSVRKLVTDGLVIKQGANPVSYSLTECGMTYSI